MKPKKTDDDGGGGGGEKQSAFDREIAAIERRARTYDSEREALGKSAAEAAKAEATFRMLEAAKKANVPVTEALRGKIDQLAMAYAGSKVRLDEAKQAQATWRDAANDFTGARADSFEGRGPPTCLRTSTSRPESSSWLWISTPQSRPRDQSVLTRFNRLMCSVSSIFRQMQISQY